MPSVSFRCCFPMVLVSSVSSRARGIRARFCTRRMRLRDAARARCLARSQRCLRAGAPRVSATRAGFPSRRPTDDQQCLSGVSARAPGLLHVKTSRGRLVLTLSSAARDTVRLGLDHPRTLDNYVGGRDLPNSSGSRSPTGQGRANRAGMMTSFLCTDAFCIVPMSLPTFFASRSIAQRIGRPFEASAVAAP
jgi:hypothetical protein